MKKLIVAALVSSLTLLIPATSQAESCIAFAQPLGSSCQYIASGPGVFHAATANHWRITIYRGTQILPGGGNGQFPSAMPVTGPIPSIAGDRVVVGIDNVWAENEVGPPLGARAGFVRMSDA